MKKKLYVLVRIDDVCPTMNWRNFYRALDIMKKYKIYPILGVIPNNEDGEQKIDAENKNFWKELKELEILGCKIAQHGYNHVYTNNIGGILRWNKNSELVGESQFKQKERIEKGMNILQKHGFLIDTYMAPSHSFDKSTIKALKELGFKYITDGYTTFKYNYMGLVFVPCMNTYLFKRHFKGIYTLCLHPSKMDNKAFDIFERTLNRYQNNLVNFNEIIDLPVHKHFKLNQNIHLCLRDITRFLSRIKQKIAKRRS